MNFPHAASRTCSWPCGPGLQAASPPLSRLLRRLLGRAWPAAWAPYTTRKGVSSQHGMWVNSWVLRRTPVTSRGRSPGSHTGRCKTRRMLRGLHLGCNTSPVLIPLTFLRSSCRGPTVGAPAPLSGRRTEHLRREVQFLANSGGLGLPCEAGLFEKAVPTLAAPFISGYDSRERWVRFKGT